VVLAITSLPRAQQPVMGRDALQLQCAVGILHDLRCGAPLQRDGTNRQLGVAMSRWIAPLHRRAGQERVVMSTALLGEPGRQNQEEVARSSFKFKHTW
jgi:hypothetical protein